MALLGGKSIAGVEIDSYEVRAVEIGGTPGSPALISVGHAALPEGAVKDGRIVKPDVVGNTLNRLWAEAGIKTRDVILGVSNQDVLLRFAYFPKVTPDKLDNVVKFQAQEFLPISLADVELDYMVLGEVSGERGPMLHILLVAAKKTMINEFISVLDAANLNAVDIDSSNLALMRMLPAYERNKSVAMVNLNKEQAGIVILKNGIPGLARISIINTNAKSSLPNLAEAELNEQSSIGNEGKADSAYTRIAMGEIKSSLAYYQNQMHYPAVEKVFVSGNAGGRKGLIEELQEGLGLKVELLDPILGISKVSTKHFTGSEPVDYAVCISLALRGLEGGNR